MKAERRISLSQLIWQDLVRHAWLIVLVFAVFVSAIAVVYSAHKTRQLTSRWEQLQEHRDELDIEWRHLLIEEMAQAEHSRVERIASQELQMKRPQPDKEIVVKPQ